MRCYELHSESLNEERKKSLRQLFLKPEVAILQQVISAKGRMAEQRAIDETHTANDSGESQDRTRLIAASLLRAQRYQLALDVLAEIQSSPDDWITLRLSTQPSP